MDDPDAMEPAGKVWVHWVVWNIDPLSLEHFQAENSQTPEIVFNDKGMNDFGEVEYGGPAPPDKRHTYVFKLYALDTILDLPEGSPKAALESAMEGHIIEQTQLTGTYAPSGGICTLERKIEDDMNWHVVEDVFDSTGEKIGERDHW